MTNKPKILFELSREDASYLMDLMHGDWARRVTEFAVASELPGQYNWHVREWLKNRPSRIMNYMDATADKQGFWENGVGL